MGKKGLTDNINSLRGFITFITIVVGFLLYSSLKSNEHIAKNYDNTMLNMHLINNLEIATNDNNSFIDFNTEKINKLSEEGSEIEDKIIEIYQELYKEDITEAQGMLNKAGIQGYAVKYAQKNHIIFDAFDEGKEIVVDTYKKTIIIK